MHGRILVHAENDVKVLVGEDPLHKPLRN
jgi:hypothetical protein